jgi:hypothetical protein
MPTKLERAVTWAVRIILVPLAAIFTWNALHDVRYLLVATPDTSILAPTVECVLAVLLVSAIFSSSPPWRNEHLKVFLTWVGSFSALLLNFYFAFAAVSYAFGRSFRLHWPATKLEEFCIFGGGLGLFLLEINLVEKVTKRNKSTRSAAKSVGPSNTSR